jgi:glycosyltransferase involved in cell wall biosynthesis
VPKVLICSPSHAVRGGVETVVADLCRYLPRHGWEAVLGLGEGGRFNRVAQYREAYPDLPTVSIDGRKGTRQARQEALCRAMRSARPDVVLVARLFDAYQAATSLKQRRGWPRLAVTIQAYEPHYLFDARLYRTVIDLCVTSGDMIRDAAVAWSGLSPDRVVSIPGGVHPPNTPVSPRSVNVVIRLGYVGRLEAGQKRILDLAALVEGLDRDGVRYALDIIGTGPAEPELRQRLAGQVQAGRVAFLGWQPRDVLYRDVFPRLHALVHFAFTEGVTIAPREAMAHGVVPIISEFIGLRRERHFLHGENALTFPVGDVKTALQSIRRLTEECGLLERLSSAAMRSQSGRYSFDGAIAAWAEALDRCLALPPRRGPVPTVACPRDGRLARWGVPPWLAQRIRDVLRRRHDHTDPGSEWPTGSGLLTREASESIWRYAELTEHGRDRTSLRA